MRKKIHTEIRNNRASAFAHSSTSGFAMLFTVLVVSLMLTLGLSISNITYKQTILSNLAKDSQIAFYQADAGVECGLHYDALYDFKDKTPSEIAQINNTIMCGSIEYTLDQVNSYVNYYFYTQTDTDFSAPCNSILIDKLNIQAPQTGHVLSRGYSTCTFSPRQVERALEVYY